MYDFVYHRPRSVNEAAALMTEAEDGRYLAGGQTLLPAMKLRLSAPSDLIDLGGIEGLSGITEEGDGLRVGALVPHAEVAETATAIPALAALAALIGDVQVRNRGTLGGSIANNDPAADYPAAVVGLGATVETNRWAIEADAFFTSLFETALEEGEIVTAVYFPKPEKAAYMKFPHPASRFAIVGVMVAQTAGGVRVAVTGAGACVFRVPEMERTLEADFAPDAVRGISLGADDLNDDIHASSEYRAHLVGVLAGRAVAAASKYQDIHGASGVGLV
ncbi:MAG: xanthine dehydrogenase family protein subunit M [Alphaproteobacteria bacterium]